MEQDDIGKVRRMLERKEVNINELNQDELTLLDVAIMLNHREVALLLLKHGATENSKCKIQRSPPFFVHNINNFVHHSVNAVSAG